MFLLIRRILLILWIFSILIIAWLLYRYESLRDPQMIRDIIAGWGWIGLILYFLVSMIRGIFLLPALPIVVAGTLLFPEDRGFIYLISMIWVISSSFLIYEWSIFLWLDQYLSTHLTDDRRDQISRLIDRYGMWGVAFWAFLPFTPTDLVCYLAGTMRMNLWKFLLGIVVGEGVIIALIVWGFA